MNENEIIAKIITFYVFSEYPGNKLIHFIVAYSIIILRNYQPLTVATKIYGRYPAYCSAMGRRISSGSPSEINGSAEHIYKMRLAAKQVGRPGVFFVAVGTAEHDSGQISVSNDDWGVRTLTEFKTANTLYREALGFNLLSRNQCEELHPASLEMLVFADEVAAMVRHILKGVDFGKKANAKVRNILKNH